MKQSVTHFKCQLKVDYDKISRENYCVIDLMNRRNTFVRRSEHKYKYYNYRPKTMEDIEGVIQDFCSSELYKELFDKYYKYCSYIDDSSLQNNIEVLEYHIFMNGIKQNDNIDNYIKEYIINHYCIFHPLEFCQKRKELILKNYDINMEFYNKLDKKEFNSYLKDFLNTYNEYKEINDLTTYKNISGIYILVLDEYCRIYIGQTNNIKKRICTHWSGRKYLDRMIFGSWDTSVISIDSFGPLDTTRIFVNTDVKSLLDEEENAVDSFFPDKYLQNRISGGAFDILKMFDGKTPFAE